MQKQVETIKFTPEKCKQIALARLDIVHQWLEFRKKSQNKLQADYDFVKLHNTSNSHIFEILGKISRGSLHRWLAMLNGTEDYTKLLPQYKYSTVREYRTVLNDDEIKIFMGLLLHPNRLSIGKAIALTKYKLKEQGQNFIPADITFRRYAKWFKDNNYDKLEDVTEQFKIGLENTRFTSQAQKEKFAKHGIDALNDYYPNFIQFPADKIEAIELNFYGVQIGGEMVTGKIDRIEKNNDGTYSLYDYKTGTPVSGNQISLGGMKEGFYNQLCFYKCAFEKYSGKKVSQVGIIYVENHTKSVYKTFDNSDMDYIENKIIDTYKNIRDLKFEPIKEDLQGPCKFCAYKQLCKLDVL